MEACGPIRLRAPCNLEISAFTASKGGSSPRSRIRCNVIHFESLLSVVISKVGLENHNRLFIQLGDIDVCKARATIALGFRFIHESMLQVFLRINILAFVFVVLSRPAHSITLILTVTLACFLITDIPWASRRSPKFGHRLLCLQNFIHRRNLGDFRPKGAGNHYIFLGGRDLEKGPWVSYLRFGRRFRCGCRYRCGGPYSFPGPSAPVVSAHRRVAAERDNNTDLGP
jgi:hypothetical protein